MPYIEFEYRLTHEPTGHSVRLVTTEPATSKWEKVKGENIYVPEQHVCHLMGRRWPAWAWPGGYPIFYTVTDGGVLCPKCANKHIKRTLDKDDTQFHIVDSDANWEDPSLHCDHCGARIESAYAEPYEENERVQNETV